MNNPIEALNPVLHAQLRVITKHGTDDNNAYGENINSIPVLIHELGHLAREYPLCFMKNPDTGQFNLYALLGFEAEENLYLEPQRWNANYIPLHIRRQPFLIGRHPTSTHPAELETGFIGINTRSKRISKTQGEFLFNNDGSATAYLESINELLSQLTLGESITTVFVQQLLHNNLLESARVNMKFNDGSDFSYEGIYTINTDKLNQLDEQKINQLQQQNFLTPIKLIIQSLQQLQHLINAKNSRLEETKKCT